MHVCLLASFARYAHRGLPLRCLLNLGFLTLSSPATTKIGTNLTLAEFLKGLCSTVYRATLLAREHFPAIVIVPGLQFVYGAKYRGNKLITGWAQRGY